MKLQLLNVAKSGTRCLNLLFVPASLKFHVSNGTWKAENGVPMACAFDEEKKKPKAL